ncbi:hypothetical protein BB776_05400 [Planococcus salinarum]|uniref:50S ribosomal protein L28 n=1 Tax=Planococcus salinarum TaxID=622695 RepID=A0ABX3D234_9BACL|nr:hypothetical protein BB776_05400 [Planococcus salinarum]
MAVGVWTPRKATAPVKPRRHKTEQRRGGLCRIAGPAYDPRGWAAGVWTPRKATAKRWRKFNLGHLFATKQRSDATVFHVSKLA